ncbi:transcriptional regulator [bacterium]|nr:transcriptional regulator [bacterium]
MKAVKRFEIVIEALYEESLLEIFDEIGLVGYTILRNVSGSGERGARSSDGLTRVMENILVIAAGTEEQGEALREPLRALLEDGGGICLASPADWLIHRDAMNEE